MGEITITEGYQPGAIGLVSAAHARYYHAHWGFGLPFEAKVAGELAAWLQRRAAGEGGLWLAWQGQALAGSIAVDAGDAAGAGARIRWFLVQPEAQGSGLGRRLLALALGHCERAGHRRIYLTTFAGLDAARRLYEQAGFTLTHEEVDTTWGVAVREQRFERG